MKIAFFDSGIGGLSVFHKALQYFPNHDYIYFADSQNVPYGSRTEEDVENLSMDAIDFLAAKNIDALVIACHTVSRLMLKKLQALYDFPIIGMQAGLEQADFFNSKKILITGTDLSVEIWKKTLKKDFLNPRKNADFLSLHRLATLAEHCRIYTPITRHYLQSKLSSYQWENYHALVLGCTHFPFFKSIIREIVPNNIRLIDGSEATIQALVECLALTANHQRGAVEYFVSKSPKSALFFNQYLDILKFPKPQEHLLSAINGVSTQCA